MEYYIGASLSFVEWVFLKKGEQIITIDMAVRTHKRNYSIQGCHGRSVFTWGVIPRAWVTESGIIKTYSSMADGPSSHTLAISRIPCKQFYQWSFLPISNYYCSYNICCGLCESPGFLELKGPFKITWEFHEPLSSLLPARGSVSMRVTDPFPWVNY